MHPLAIGRVRSRVTNARTGTATDHKPLASPLVLLRSAPRLRPLPFPPRAKPWRPLPDDVERLSSGGGAKKRGTGSFHVPHRLALDEKAVFAAAKKNAFLTVRGSGGRRGAKRGGGKGSGRPLLNTWRQWCDAKGWATVVVEQAAGQQQQARARAPGEGERDDGGDSAAAAADDDAPSSSSDAGSSSDDDGAHQMAPSSTSASAVAAVVIVDFATLRRLDARAFAEKARRAAAEAGARELGVFERGDGEVPFDVLAAGGEAAEMGDEGIMADEEAAAMAAVAAVAAAAVPGRVPLREERAAAGHGGNSGEDEAPSSSSAEPALPDDHPYATSAIWSIPAQPLFFALEEGARAKQLAAALAKAVCGGGGSAKAKARRKRVFDGDDDDE